MSGHDHFGHRNGYWRVIECGEWRLGPGVTSMFLPCHFGWLTLLLLSLLLLLLYSSCDAHAYTDTRAVLFTNSK